MVFVSRKKNTSLQRFYFKTNRKTLGFSKMWYYEFLKYPFVSEIGMFLCDNHWRSILQF